MNALAASPALAAGIMDLNPGLTLWTAITFILLIFVLGKYAFGPIVKMLDERERTIRDSIDSAKRERAEAEKLLVQQKDSLLHAQREAAEIAKRNQQDMETYRTQLTALAKKESDTLVAGARKQIEEEKTKAVAELRAEVADLAIAAAARIVKSSLDEKTQRQLVDDYIKDLPVGRA
ncbi:MAG: F0F1 ATP synthase subunit B [Deltaproteobacteria bacterium]|jgi:F-type H+-transporting ATPase subunit b|nr:F0F1 ATP synthase subunit B [Deltaproteobacteria bacterium]